MWYTKETKHANADISGYGGSVNKRTTTRRAMEPQLDPGPSHRSGSDHGAKLCPFDHVGIMQFLNASKAMFSVSLQMC